MPPRNTEGFSGSEGYGAAVASPPESEEQKRERRLAIGAGNEQSQATGQIQAAGNSGDQKQATGNAGDQKQAAGNANDQSQATGQKQASDIRQATDTAGIEHKPDYKAMIDIRLTENHPKTAEAFREGNIAKYDSDRRLMGLQASKMETEVRHVVGAVAELGKDASRQERWDMSVAATDQMLARQSLDNDKKEAQAAYAGTGGSQNVYQSVFDKMTDRQQTTMGWYKQQMALATERAADPSQANYTEKNAAKDIRRLMRDANKYLVQEGVLDKKGNISESFQQQVSNAQILNAINGLNERVIKLEEHNFGRAGPAETGSAQNGSGAASGAAQASGNGAATHVNAANGANAVTGVNAANGTGAVTGNSQESGAAQESEQKQNQFGAKVIQAIDLRMEQILNGQHDDATKQEQVKDLIYKLAGNAGDNSDQRNAKNVLTEAAVAAYRDDLINNHANDKDAYQQNVHDVYYITNATRISMPENYTNWYDNPLKDFAADGKEMQALRAMAGSPDDGAASKMQNTLLDNVADIRDNSNDIDQMNLNIAAFRELEAMKVQWREQSDLRDAIAASPADGDPPSGIKGAQNVTASYIKRSVTYGNEAIEGSTAADAATAAIVAPTANAAAGDHWTAVKALQNQAEQEGQFIMDAGLHMERDLPDVKAAATEDGLKEARQQVDAHIAQWNAKAGPIDWNGAAEDGSVYEPGHFTVNKLAQEARMMIDDKLATGNYETSPELDKRLAMLEQASQHAAGGSKS